MRIGVWRVLGVVVAGVLVVLALFVATIGYVYSYQGYAPKSVEADCAVVFGAAVYPGGFASTALQERTETALQLYKDGKVACIIFSGADSAYQAHEVDVMYGLALVNAIPTEAIELDYTGFNTQQTIQNVLPTRSYAFVSNDFHLPRIQLLAYKAGLTNYVLVPSEYKGAHYTKEWQFIFREAVALWYYALL